MRALLFLLITAIPLFAKRAAPPDVAPVHHDGIIYTATNSPEKMGVVTATDEVSGKVVWEKKIYAVRLNPALEKDVQHIFISDMKMQGDLLAITNEHRENFLVNPKTGVAKRVDVLGLRFPAETLTALRSVKDTVAFPADVRLARPTYDKKAAQQNVDPIVRSLEQQEARSSPSRLDDKARAALLEILLEPNNHSPGLFTAVESPTRIVKFQSGGKTGWIILYHSLVAVIWNGHESAALLNTAGTAALQDWAKANP